MTAAHPTSARIDLRTSRDIKALIVRAAAASGLSVSAFLVSAGRERARQVLSDAESITLSPDDWESFFSALDSIDTPRPRLAAAMDRYRTWLAERETP